jgi:hypothetical protein
MGLLSWSGPPTCAHPSRCGGGSWGIALRAEKRGRRRPHRRDAIACPIAAMLEWLTAANITEGPVFRAIGRGGRLQVQKRGRWLPQQLPLDNK